MGIDTHLKNKKEALNKLEELKSKVLQPILEIEDIKVDDAFQNKIDNTFKQLEDEKFVIAMFGSFSDGKSSIIKSITGESNIAISPIPTTDKVEEYNYDNSLIIVDTPGLFSENDIHSETTRKYISEANLIIYVIDSENPIKDSQKETVRWLLKDLNKIDSTLFIINKMDVVVDLENEEDYEEGSNIKREVVADTLKQLGVEPNYNNILAIASDPYGNGFDYWQDNKKIYDAISRVPKLKEKLDEYIEKYKETLLFSNVNSVVQDCLTEMDKVLKDKKELNNNIIEIKTSQIEDANNKLEQLKKDVDNSYNNIKDRIKNIRTIYINQINRINNLQEYNAFYNEYIGEDSYILNDEIDNIIKQETENSIKEQKRISQELDSQAKKYDAISDNIMKKIIGETSNKITKSIRLVPKEKLASGIKIFRDSAKIPVKFKPWGIQKLAKQLKFGGAVLGVGLDFLNVYSENKKKQELDQYLMNNKEFINHYFKELNDKIEYKTYVQEYFPILNESQENIKLIQEELRNMSNTNSKIEEVEKNIVQLTK